VCSKAIQVSKSPIRALKVGRSVDPFGCQYLQVSENILYCGCDRGVVKSFDPMLRSLSEYSVWVDHHLPSRTLRTSNISMLARWISFSCPQELPSPFPSLRNPLVQSQLLDLIPPPEAIAMVPRSHRHKATKALQFLKIIRVDPRKKLLELKWIAFLSFILRTEEDPRVQVC
jgi:hypothetical protein